MTDEQTQHDNATATEHPGDRPAEEQAPQRELTKDERKRLSKLESRFATLVAEYAGLVEELDDVFEQLAELDAAPEDALAAPRASDAAGLEQKASDADAAYRRVLADYANFQRRSRENEQRAKEGGRASVLESMVEVLDIFDLASKLDPDTTTPQAMLQGVEMIKGEMIRKLAASGFTTIEPSPGSEFDPHSHEAVGHEHHDEVEPGRVVRAHKPGYKLNDRVLRAAHVLVRPAEPAGDTDQPGAPENDTENPENPA